MPSPLRTLWHLSYAFAFFPSRLGIAKQWNRMQARCSTLYCRIQGFFWSGSPEPAWGRGASEVRSTCKAYTH